MRKISALRKKSVQAEIRFNPRIQEISRLWNDLRKIENKEIIDLKNDEEIFECLCKVRKHIAQAFSEEYPGKEKTTENIIFWSMEKAVAFEEMKDMLNRNIWIDLYSCIEHLEKKGLLKNPPDL